MSAPRLNVPLLLEAPQRVEDGIGGYALEWRVLGQVWADMRASAGREVRGETGAVSTVAWAITLRGAPAGDPRRPQPGQRLRHGEMRIFRIEAVAESGPDGRLIVCHSVEEDAP